MARIGIYGGTFNPPHIGHMRAAGQTLARLELDQLLLIPDGIAPHKRLPEGTPSPEQRLDMLRLAAAGMDGVRVSDMEIRRGGISYTVDTILALRQQYPSDQLVLILGTDMFLTFDQWKQPDTITANAALAVLYRGEKGERASIETQKAKLEGRGVTVTLIENPVTPISSTDLRRLLAFDCADPFLPEGVGEYIRANGLYAIPGGYRGLSMEALEAVVTGLLKPSRVAHVLGCRDTAVALARHWGADETDAARAGLLHDITKALDGPLQLTLCREYATILNDFSQRNPKTLHALTGSLVAERIFGENPRVVAAIRHHTTGRADMALLEKIIYVADYMEPNRTIPGVDRLRELAFTDIDAALRLGLEMTLDHLKNQGAEVSPESREALHWLNTHQ